MSASSELTAEQIVRLAAEQIKLKSDTAGYIPQAHQIPPDEEDHSWDTWLLLGGRGSGKTRTGTEYVMKHLRRYGKQARVGVMAPTIKSSRDVCADGESGVMQLYEAKEFKKYNKTQQLGYHEYGGTVKFMGAENVASWRGPQWSLLWIDEYASCDPEAIELALMALRLGQHPRLIVTTTPLPIPNLRTLAKHPRTIMTKATTFDNPYISQAAVTRMEATYGGTRLGRQELYGELLEDVEGAFWSSSQLDANRVKPEEISIEDMDRVVVAVDPATAVTVRSDDTAICVAGRKGRHYYIFRLEALRAKPFVWASMALRLYRDFQADCVVAERNNGADLVTTTINSVYDNMRKSREWSGSPLNLRTVWASRGKQTRAEPIASLDEQGYIHHVGFFPDAEEQMTTYPVAIDKDDMVDARVWAITELSGNVYYDDILPVSFMKESIWSI